MPQTTVLIATSMKRTEWLINRSLRSVYNQENINTELIDVLIVDDNKDEGELLKIKSVVKELRKNLNLPTHQFPTNIIRNTATKFNSGTGAWNTGIKSIYNNHINGFIAILDDDDEYLPNHLNACISNIKEHTLAVFQSLEWKNHDNSIVKFPLNLKKLTPLDFFKGNPGVQGSNMFFKTETLIAINGFDENLPNTTDRDLMIRFLQHVEPLIAISVIEKVGVIHYNHDNEKVNNNLPLKQKGLDLFYTKYKNQFSESAFQDSLKRAKHFFNYQYYK